MLRKTLQIIVPIGMLLVIFTLWHLNNTEERTAAHTDSNTTLLDKSFALNSAHIDLKELKKFKLPIIIDFGADACIPCKEMAPVLLKLSAEMQNKAIIKFVDVWKNPEAAKEFPVQVIPTQVFFQKDGKPYTPKNIIDIEFFKVEDKNTKEHMFTIHQGGLSEDQMRRILKDMES